MVAPIPRNPNNQQNANWAQQVERLLHPRQVPPEVQLPQNIFMDEAELPPGRIALWVNRVIRWLFFGVVEGIIISFCFNVLGLAFEDAPEFIRPIPVLFQVAVFLILSYHAIFRINIFR